MRAAVAKQATARQIEDLRLLGGLQGRDIANFTNVSPATVSRWEAGSTSPKIALQTLMASIRYVVLRLSDFYEPDEARLWLSARHPLLDNERPIDVVKEGRIEEVLAIIERLDAGVYI